MKPSAVARIQEILILSSVHLQRIRARCVLGGQYRVKQSKMCCK